MGGDPLRVVVVGLGRHAVRTVIPAITATPGWELTGVVSSRSEARTEASDTHGVPGFPTLQAALEGGRPDFAYIASAPSHHAADVREALEARLGVVCEKPLGVDAAEVSGLLGMAEGADGCLCEVVAYLHHPQFAAAAALLGDERFGELVHGYARFSYPHLDEGNHRYRADLGGGALLDAGFYPLSLAARLLGGDVEVQATGWTGGRDVDLSGAATIAAPDGRTFQCSWGIGSSYANLARLVGTAGSLEITRPFSKPAGYAEPITLIGRMGERTEVTYPAADQFAAMLGDVGRHRGDPAWRASIRDGIAARWSVIGRVADSISAR
ncbi:MAG: Gfo/Idh/MocA family oxidoreductase [Actinobacteria bacterium]|nr:Gfo/Idh/MocA family oxidoreductase [Actinomycetota bacterium]